MIRSTILAAAKNKTLLIRLISLLGGHMKICSVFSSQKIVASRLKIRSDGRLKLDRLDPFIN